MGQFQGRYRLQQWLYSMRSQTDKIQSLYQAVCLVLLQQGRFFLLKAYDLLGALRPQGGCRGASRSPRKTEFLFRKSRRFLRNGKGWTCVSRPIADNVP